MTTGNFTELLGKVSDFGITGFDSISGADLQVVYGLDGDDNLNSTGTFSGGELADGKSTSILVGGTGKNNYQIRNNSTIIVLENDSNNDNILWTTIGADGLSLNKETSFVAEIDSRHLYLGDTATDQYVILIDWQEPANQIESFDLTAGFVTYEDFANSYQNFPNYRGNLTWEELVATGEIDLARLGLSAETIDKDLATINQRAIELEITSKGGIFLIGTDEGEFLDGSPNNENYSDRTIYRFYNTVSATHFYTGDRQERNYVYDNLANYTYEGASYVGVPSSVSPGIRPRLATEPVGVYRYLNRDTRTHLYTTDANERNFIDRELDNFTAEGEAFQAYQIQVDSSIPIYRFYNTNTGTHFYTPEIAEKEFIEAELANFESEGIAYYALPIESLKV